MLPRIRMCLNSASKANPALPCVRWKKKNSFFVIHSSKEILPSRNCFAFGYQQRSRLIWQNIMDLPTRFIKTIENTFPDEGRRWLAELPDLIQLAAKSWNLTHIIPVENLSYNFVAFAQQNEKEVVLKIGVPNRELVSEIAALNHFNGDGCVSLVKHDPDHFMFLLERLRPGEMLASLADDDLRTHIACEVMTNLWRPAPEGQPFIKLSEWFGQLKLLRPRYGGGAGPFPKDLLERAESLIPELFTTSSPPVLIHGDLHHYNILSAGENWLAIDPKGVIGHPEYECGPLLTNPIDEFLQMPDPVKITERRIAILSDRLGFSRERIRDWGLCHSVLSAWWSLTEDDNGVEYSIACAEIIAKAKI
jgi:streptomycin 6-kinase